MQKSLPATNVKNNQMADKQTKQMTTKQNQMRNDQNTHQAWQNNRERVLKPSKTLANTPESMARHLQCHATHPLTPSRQLEQALLDAKRGAHQRRTPASVIASGLLSRLGGWVLVILISGGVLTWTGIKMQHAVERLGSDYAVRVENAALE